MALKGVSDKLKQQLSALASGYTPDDEVKKAKAEAQKAQAAVKKEYKSSYAEPLKALTGNYLDRGDFDYSINTDKLYTQYADMYKRQAERAMRDTAATASALSGGYGNSYAATAAAQSYQSYLDKLGDIIPTLEKNAYDKYIQQGKDILEGIGVLRGLEGDEYSKYRDSVEDSINERDYYNDNYRYESEAALDGYTALADYLLTLAGMENADAYKELADQNEKEKLKQNDRKLSNEKESDDKDAELRAKELILQAQKLANERYADEEERKLSAQKLINDLYIAKLKAGAK